MLLKNTEGKKDTDMEMTVASADLLADLIEKGLQEENMLIEALMCFIETESHLDLIPVISSRLPSVQFTSGYWNDKGPYCWNPVFSAVMHCSGIEVFRALRDADFPLFPVVDLRFYPDPEGFLEQYRLEKKNQDACEAEKRDRQEARENGRLAQVKYYLKKEGLGKTIKRLFGYLRRHLN